MELGNLMLRLTQRGRTGEGLGHALARDSSGQTELRIVAGIIGLGAMTGRFTAAAHYGRDRTRPQIAQAEEFFKESGSLRFKTFEDVRHGASFLNVIIRSAIFHKKRKLLR
jgi:ABC-type enterobactin transport system permease subunit